MDSSKQIKTPTILSMTDNEEAGKLFDEFAYEYLEETNDRNIVLIASSKIDDMLLEILTVYFLPKTSSKRDSDELLEGDRPLSTFSARIKILYRLGLIDQSFSKILETVRDIRNKSAHTVVFSLKKTPMKDKIDNLVSLVGVRESYNNIWRQYYGDTASNREASIKCSYLTICFILETIRLMNIKASGNVDTIRISKK